MKVHRLNIDISEELYEDLKLAAIAQKTSVAVIARRVLQDRYGRATNQLTQRMTRKLATSLPPRDNDILSLAASLANSLPENVNG